jgi:hypothetical protein
VPLSLSPEQRSLRASIAAHSRWAKEDPKIAMVVVRDAYLNSFRYAVDPDLKLPEDERERRAHAALRAHMAKLALASSRARAKRKANSGNPEPGGEAA